MYKVFILISLICLFGAQEIINDQDVTITSTTVSVNQGIQQTLYHNQTNNSIHYNYTGNSTYKNFTLLNQTIPMKPLPPLPPMDIMFNISTMPMPQPMPGYHSYPKNYNFSNYTDFNFTPPNHYYHWPRNESDRNCSYKQHHEKKQRDHQNMMGDGYQGEEEEQGKPDCKHRKKNRTFCHILLVVGFIASLFGLYKLMACCKRQRSRQFYMVRNDNNQNPQQIQMAPQNVQQQMQQVQPQQQQYQIQYPQQQQQRIPSYPIIINHQQQPVQGQQQQQQIVYGLPIQQNQQRIQNQIQQQQAPQPIMIQAMGPNGQPHMIIGIPVVRPQQQMLQQQPNNNQQFYPQVQQPSIAQIQKPVQVEQEEKKDEQQPVLTKSKYPELQVPKNIQIQNQQQVMGIPQNNLNMVQYNYPPQQN